MEDARGIDVPWFALFPGSWRLSAASNDERVAIAPMVRAENAELPQRHDEDALTQGHPAAEKAVEVTLGARWSQPYADVVHSKLVILWGHNPVSTAPHFLPFLQEARRKGCEVVGLESPIAATRRSAGGSNCTTAIDGIGAR